MNAVQIWNAWTWKDKEIFLRKHYFPLGYSAHTWSQLPRKIQAKLEEEA